jgi:hypothetical protein
VDVVTHHRIGINANGKDLRQFQQALLDPCPSVLVGRSIARIDTTQPGPAHASRNAVIGTRSVTINKKAAGRGHAESLRSGNRVVCRKFPTPDAGNCRNHGCPAYLDIAAHKAARNFLFFASGGTYHEDQPDKIEVAPQ